MVNIYWKELKKKKFMHFTRTAIHDLVICEPTVRGDERGYFVETFRQDKLNELPCYFRTNQQLNLR